MFKQTLSLMLAGSLLATAGALADGRSLAEQKAARHAGKATPPPERVLTQAEAAPAPGPTAAELAAKAELLKANGDRLRIHELEQRLASGQGLVGEDRLFYTRYRESLVRKGGDHAVDEGGPDAFGNTWIMTGDEGGPGYSWVDLPVEDRIPVSFPGGPDSYSGPFDLPQPISFYGQTYTQFYVSAKGYLGFDPTNMQDWSNGPLPDGNFPNAQIYVFWDDMNPVASSGGEVYYGLDGEGRLVVTWDTLYQYFDGPGWITVQAVLDPANSQVLCSYAGFGGAMNLSSCTVGIEDHSGNDGLQVLYDGQPFTPAEETTIRFDLAPPPDYAAAFNSSLLTIPVGSPGTNWVPVTLTNTGLLPHSLELSANMESLDIRLWDSEGLEEIGSTPVLDPFESFPFRVEVTAEEGLGQFVDSGIVLAVSSGDQSEVILDVQAPVIATHGGPDTFGNRWYLSGDPEGTDPFWVDLPVEDRTPLVLFDDASAGPIDLGGVVSYYGTARTQVYVSSNGYIGFLPDFMYSAGNTPLPSDFDFSPNSIIALFWRDLNPGSGGQVYYGHDAEGRFVLTYDQVMEFGGSGNFTAQIVIEFQTQRIFLNYNAFENNILMDFCTVGIENDFGDDGLQVFLDGQPTIPTAGSTIRFDLAPPPDYAVDLPETAEVVGSANGTFEQVITVYNSGLLEESYSLELDGGSLFGWSIVDEQGNPITGVGPIPSLEGREIRVRMVVPDDPTQLEEFVTLSAVCEHDPDYQDMTLIRGISVPSSGSDAWGNSWVSSLDEGGPGSTWIELAEQDRTYVDFPNGPDSYNGPFELPQALTFYGGVYTQFYVSAKAYMGFLPENMQTWTNSPIPSQNTPNAQIYVFWNDMNPVAQSGGSVYYGTDEDGRLVVTWDELRTYPDGPAWITVQAVVDAAANRLLLNYHEFSGDMPLDVCTVGIENEEGTVALQVLHDGDPFVPTPGLTIQVDLAPPPDYWFGMTDFVATTGQVDSEVAGTFTIYNTGLAADSYQLFGDNPDGFDVHTEINGVPAVVTPQVPPGGSIEVDLVITIPEFPAEANTLSSLQATSVGNPQLTRTGSMETRIVLVQGGPDAGGYYWSTTDAEGQVEYEWITPDNPVFVPLSDDSFGGPFDLGFTWTHYGQEYTQVYIASNGYIGFSEDGMWSLSGQDMPDPATPNGLICGFHDDLNPSSGGSVSYSAQGGRFVVTFDGVPEFGGGGTITFQIVLDADDEAVKINYQSLDGLNMSFFTVGQEDATGSQGFTASLWGDGWLPTDESSVWFGFNVIGPSGPYAVDIDPGELSGVGINGGYAEYEFEVENRGENASTFELSVSGNIWDVSFHDIENGWAEITQVPSIVYDQIFALGVRVHVPDQPESYTDQALVRATATGHPEAFAEGNILTAASCNHVHQMIGNVTGNGLFGMAHLSDGEYTDNNTLVFVGSGVNRMITLGMDGTVGPISVLPAGHDYLGIAYDSRDDSYWVSYTGGIAHVGNTGSLIAAFTPPLLAGSTGRVPTGLAFDADNQILWAICSRGSTDDFVRIDVSDASNPVGLNAVTVPWSSPFGSGAAGIDYHEATNQLVALHTVTGNSECFLDLGNGSVDARGDFCPSGLAEGHGVALTPDGDLFIGWTSGLAHPVDQYRAPCDFGVEVEDRPLLPLAFELGANYPNPFNPSTTLGYALPAAGQVQLQVYNLMGQHLATLVDGVRPAGYHEVLFDAGNLASGVYFYRVSVTDLAGRPQYQADRKMMLIR
jgi:hypothetical protein